jgi:hypothetical protein
MRYARALFQFLGAVRAGEYTLPTGGQQLAFFCHNEAQRSLLARRGRDIKFKRDRQLSFDRVNTHWPNVTNGMLIHSRGGTVHPPCDRCARGLTPFCSCRQAPGFFLGDCSGCRFSRKICSLRGQPPRALVSLGPFIRIADPADRINGRLLIGSGTPNDPFIVDGEDPGDVIEVPRPQGLVVDLSDDEDEAGITVDKARGSTADGELEGDDVGAEIDV